MNWLINRALVWLGVRQKEQAPPPWLRKVYLDGGKRVRFIAWKCSDSQ